jgi:hypothetical protein
MRDPLRVCGTARPQEMLKNSGSEPDSRAAFWRINGCRARLLIWTPDEWRKMEPRPTDAQYHPCGVWCALRID